MEYEIREVNREVDLPYLHDFLRPADKNELKAVTGSDDHLESIERSIKASTEVLVGAAIGKPAGAIFGIGEVSEKTHMIWAVGTDDLEYYRVPFLRESLYTIWRWFKERPQLENMVNFVHADNKDHHRWLRWAGAELHPAVPFGVMGEDFHPFRIHRSRYHV